MPVPAVFLDRDGTIIREEHYLSRPAQVALLPGAGAAIGRLNAAGVPVVVVTNQAGVARGYFPECRVAEVHARLSELLAADGAAVAGYYHCPHHPAAVIDEYRIDCECRKPRPGLLLTAARELGLDPARSWMVGDKRSDLEAGAAAGCRTVLVRTGYGAEVGPLPADELRLAGVVDDLAAAMDLVL
jgi:D-glycero-D-manno-heptose 1,7-bisphosphate phosphatase